jgi:D-beta-D-heptose 7-phosphate kinase/D-beta-D-heptose 1-phosphate adenosyltransferase
MADGSLVARLAGASVAVVGDVMLDNHVFGQVSRVSEEAPVPVLLVKEERQALGGAANVAANITALGGRARLIGMIGADAAAERLMSLIGETRIDPRLFAARDRPTIAKTRYLGARQQIVRVDREVIAPAPERIQDEIIEEIEEAAAECDVLVASDYGKGVLTDRVLAALMRAAAAHAKPVIVDPKRADFSAYRGARFIKPNRRELALATGMPCETDEEARAAALSILPMTGGASILLTRSEKGMSLFSAQGAPVHLPAEAREVADVSGAGDTVTGVFALGLAAGMATEQAMRLANAAAGVTVAKIGAATVSPGELNLALGARASLPRLLAPVASLAEARERRRTWAAQGLVVGFANGVFDIIHPGHVSLIAQAAAACDRLIVALNTDESVRRLGKGADRPIQDLASRAAVIGAMRGVDLVLGFPEDTPLETIRALEPDVLIKGADYKDKLVVGADIVVARGGRVVLAELTPGQSTTNIVKKSAGAA